MKTTFLTILITVSAYYINAQEARYSIDDPIEFNESGEVSFHEVIQVENASASELYTNARQWVAQNYRSAQDVLQMDDSEANILIGKANVKITSDYGISSQEERLFYTFNIQCRDGRYRVEIKDIYFRNYDSNELNVKVITDEYLYTRRGSPRRLNQSYKENTINFINNTFASIEDAMKSSIIDVDDDW